MRTPVSNHSAAAVLVVDRFAPVLGRGGFDLFADLLDAGQERRGRAGADPAAALDRSHDVAPVELEPSEAAGVRPEGPVFGQHGGTLDPAGTGLDQPGGRGLPLQARLLALLDGVEPVAVAPTPSVDEDLASASLRVEVVLLEEGPAETGVRRLPADLVHSCKGPVQVGLQWREQPWHVQDVGLWGHTVGLAFCSRLEPVAVASTS